MSTTFPFSDPTSGSHQDQISRQAFEQLVSIRGEGDEWDFKETLGDLSKASARVNLAKDALAFCNLSDGGSLIIGVTDSYEKVGLSPSEKIDTTTIRNAIEKYIDGEFIVLAAEHLLSEDGNPTPKRYGIVHFRRRSAQPVLAALDGHTDEKQPKFRAGAILVRKGAASHPANSGDVRRLLTSSVVHEEQVRAVNEMWNALVEQRRGLGPFEFLYDVFSEDEYEKALQRPELRSVLGRTTTDELAANIDKLQLRVILLRPHLSENLYQQYRLCSAFIGRVHWNVIQKRNAGAFNSWTKKPDGSPDDELFQLASQLLPANELEAMWSGRESRVGLFRPLRPMIDAAENEICEGIRKVLSGLT